MQETVEQHSEAVSDSYHTKRALRNSDYGVVVTLSNIFETVEDELCFEFQVKGETFYIIPEESQVLSLIDLISKDDTTGEFKGELKPKFIDGFSRVQFLGSNEEFPTRSKEDITVGAEDVKSQLDMMYEYCKNTSVDDVGWKQNISKISMNEESLTVTVEIENKTHSFELQGPEISPEVDPATRLIEVSGGGEPNMLEGEPIYLVHTSRTDYTANILLETTNGEWDLMTEQDYQLLQKRKDSFFYTSFPDGFVLMTLMGILTGWAVITPISLINASQQGITTSNILFPTLATVLLSIPILALYCEMKIKNNMNGELEELS